MTWTRASHRAGVVAAIALAATTVIPAPVGGVAAAPVVGYYQGSGIRVATTGGATIADFGNFGSFSQQGELFAGTAGAAHRIVVGYELPSGTEQFRISGALQPTVVSDSGRLAFWGTGSRDRQNNSVWMREPSGYTRRLVQFSNGGGLPGHDAGLDGEGTILSTSFDATGSRLALAEGNDVDLLVYDVFTLNTTTRALTRITGDHRSRFPALTPNGRYVVFQRDFATCAPYIRATRLVIATVSGSWRETLTGANCNRWLSGPRFVSQSEVVAYLINRTGSEYETDLARVDVRTGRWWAITSTGDVSFFSADPINHTIAYSRDGVSGFRIRDMVGGGTTAFPTGDLPHLSGDHTTL